MRAGVGIVSKHQASFLRTLNGITKSCLKGNIDFANVEAIPTISICLTITNGSPKFMTREELERFFAACSRGSGGSSRFCFSLACAAASS